MGSNQHLERQRSLRSELLRQLVLLLPKLGEYGSFASFCNSSFLWLALDFLMSYRFWYRCSSRAEPVQMRLLRLKRGLLYRNVGKQFRLAAKFF
jgi:hypothetical protein